MEVSAYAVQDILIIMEFVLNVILHVKSALESVLMIVLAAILLMF